MGKFENGDTIMLDTSFGIYFSVISDIDEKNNTCILHDFNSNFPNLGCNLAYITECGKVASSAEIIIYG